jgi:hypothetical protein
MTRDEVEPLLELVVAWAAARADIVGVGLVGSWAYGNARPDSDVDFVLLTPTPQAFRQSDSWLRELDWSSAGFQVAHWRDEDYGPLWSRHITLAPPGEVECGFAPPAWAATEPLDAGTREVVSHALRVLLDKEGHFARLQVALEEKA